AYDARHTSDVLNVFIRALFGELRRRAHELLGLDTSQRGALTIVQRFGDALNANPHFHCLAIDGVYAAGGDGRPEFHPLPTPEDEDVLRLTTLVSQRVQSLLERRGLGTEANPREADPLSQDDAGTAALLAHSVRRRIAVGSNTGRGVVRLGDQVDPDSLDAFESPRCAMVSGFSVHANICIEARDRPRLERLIRYAARPAVATERLSPLPDGRLLYRLKRPWRDGTSAVIFEPQDFMAKLAVLAPAPRAHLTRYHGILGPAAVSRPLIIPTARGDHREITRNPPPSPGVSPARGVDAEPAPQTLSSVRPRNYTWAELMKRVFLVDVLLCERCGGAMKILAAIHPPETTSRILESLDLPSRAPPLF
ncbi:MAG: transposase, partial [Acidobacteria bacterium]|nr:transposase [Acidobacteriota bacterium]